MASLLSEQMDLFEGMLFPEFIQAEKIRVLEEQHHNLRRGLFKRWNQQEKKITNLNEQLTKILDILEEKEESQ